MRFWVLGVNVNISYFVNLYPAVSHTFIKREIAGVESMGWSIQRLSLRSGVGLVGQNDAEELGKTAVLLKQNPISIAVKALWFAFNHPLRVLSTLCFAISYSVMRGVSPPRIFAYVIEAILVCIRCQQHKSEHLRVHLGGQGAVIARLARRMGGPPFSIAYHGPDEFDAARRWDFDGAVSESVFVTAITHDCKAKLCRWVSPTRWERIHILRCGVDESFLKREPMKSGGRKRVAVIARLEAQKGLPFLLDALKVLSTRVDLTDVHIVGDGSMRQMLHEHSRKLGLDNRVRFLSAQSSDGVRETIKSSEALILPSFSEGLPVVLMEAMGLGRPVIASWCAGVPELVRPGRDGWTFAPGDLAGLVDALEQFMGMSTDALDEMGKSAQQQVCKMHDSKRLANQLATLLQTSAQCVSRNQNAGLISDGLKSEQTWPCESGVLNAD